MKLLSPTSWIKKIWEHFQFLLAFFPWLQYNRRQKWKIEMGYPYVEVV